MTLGQMINRAMQRANVIRENESATAEQSDDAIRVFNGFMSELDADGFEVGDFPVTATTDTLSLERQHETPIEVIFAMHLQIFHGLELEQGLVVLAERAERFIMRNTIGKTDFNLYHAPLGGRPYGFDINNG